MPESGEDQRLEMFFKNVVKGFAELRASQALKQQAEMVATTIGGHVREVLGPVQEGVDVIKNTFANTWGFVKGAMDDLGEFFGMDEKVEERMYRGTSLQQGAEIIEESQRSNELFIQGQEASWDMFEQQMDAWAKMYDINQEIVEETKAGFKLFAEQLGISTKTEKERLEEAKKKRLEEMRETKKKDRTFWGRVFDLIMAVVFGPFAILAGVIAGFVAMFTKVLLLPLRGVAALGRALGFIPKVAKPLEKATKGMPRWLGWIKKIPILGKVFEYLAKNPWIGKMFRLGKFVGGKILFPLFLFFDALRGLSKYKKIFGKHAGLREAIESAIAGIASGIFQLPAKAFDWVMKKVLGIETNLSQYFSIETIAKSIHWIGDKFNEWFIKPVQNYINDPETEKTFSELNEATERARKAFIEMMKGWRDKLAGWWEKHFGEEARRKAQEEFEKMTPEQRAIEVQQAFPGEVYAPRESKLSPEELAMRAEKWEQHPINKWIKENLDVGNMINKNISKLSETINLLADIMEGKPVDVGKAQQTVANAAMMLNPITAGAHAARVATEPKEELANPGVLLYNKQ